MKVRTVTIRPPNDDDDIRNLVNFGRSVNVDAAVAVAGIEASFSAPDYGWILLKLSANGHAADWDLAYAPDPFSLRRDRHRNGYCLTLIAWLEDIAAGQSPAFGIDMEGPVGAILVSGAQASPIVTLLALTDPDRLDFAVRIERYVLVRDIYTALIAYWESDLLISAWSEWSSKPKWNLHSSIVEDYLARA